MPTPSPQFFDFTFWQNFASNGLATVIGIGIGIPVALWLSNIQEKATEREKKRKILVTLKGELELSKHEIDRMLDNKVLREECGSLSSMLRNELWKAFSDGGDLQWIKDAELLNQIADSYYSIRATRDLANRFYDSVQNATEATSTIRIGDVFETLQLSVSTGSRSIEISIKEIEKNLV